MAVTAGLLALAAVGVGENKTGAAKNIPLGLDLAGGVSITYQAKGETPSAEEMNDTIYKLQKRVEGYSTEAQVYPQGDNRINIEIPGVTDANAISTAFGLNHSFADILTGIILFFIIGCEFFISYKLQFRKKAEKEVQ